MPPFVIVSAALLSQIYVYSTATLSAFLGRLLCLKVLLACCNSPLCLFISTVGFFSLVSGPLYGQQAAVVGLISSKGILSLFFKDKSSPLWFLFPERRALFWVLDSLFLVAFLFCRVYARAALLQCLCQRISTHFHFYLDPVHYHFLNNYRSHNFLTFFFNLLNC